MTYFSPMRLPADGAPVETDEAKGLLSAPPTWFGKAGWIGLAVAAAAAIGSLAVLPYRSTIELPVTLTRAVQSAPVVATTDGVVLEFPLSDGASVHAGEMIAAVGAKRDFDVVRSVQAFLNNGRADDIDFTATADLERARDAWMKVDAAMEELREQQQDATVPTTLAGIAGRRLALDRQNRNAAAQVTLSRQVEAELANQLAELQKVADQGWVSKARLREQRRILISQEMLTAQKSSDQASLDQQGAELSAQMALARLQRLHSLRSAEDRVQEAKAQLASAIEQWRDRHIARAPRDGTLRYFERNRTGTLLASGDNIALVEARGHGLIVTGYAPAAGADHLNPGQRSLVRFDKYPSDRYPPVHGTVTSLSRILVNGSYRVEIAIDPRDLTGLTLEDGLLGNAKIVMQSGSLGGYLLRRSAG